MPDLVYYYLPVGNLISVELLPVSLSCSVLYACPAPSHAREEKARRPLHLTGGGYRIEDNGWLVAGAIGTWPQSLSAAIDAAITRDTISIDAASDALASLGIAEGYQMGEGGNGFQIHQTK